MGMMNEYAVKNQVEVAINPVDLICLGAQLWCCGRTSKKGKKLQNLIHAHRLREKFPMTVASWTTGQSNFYECHKVPDHIRTNFEVLSRDSPSSSGSVKKKQTTAVVDESDEDDGEGGTLDSVDVANKDDEATQVSDFVIALRPEGLVSSLNARITEKPHKIPHNRLLKTTERVLYTESQAVEAYNEIKAYLRSDCTNANKLQVHEALTKHLIPLLPMANLMELETWTIYHGMYEMAKMVRDARKLGDDKPTSKSYEDTKYVQMPFMWSARPLLNKAAEIHQWADCASHPDVFIRLGNELIEIAEDHREHLDNQNREMETLRQLIDKFAIGEDQSDKGGQLKASLKYDPVKTRKRRRVTEDDESDESADDIFCIPTPGSVKGDAQETMVLRFGAQALASAKKAGGNATANLLSYMRQIHPDKLVDRIVEECKQRRYTSNA